MTMTFKILSALMQYPSAELQAAVPEMRQLLADEGLLSSAQCMALEPLFAQISAADLLEIQENYTDLFDRGRAHSLYLFEHVHGESRDRGQAMVDLRERYLDAGLEPVSNELPDFLPQFLEYCSVLPLADALEKLSEPGLVLAALAVRLGKRMSQYAAVLIALCDLARVDRGIDAESAIAPADNPDDLEALDAAWEVEEVRFAAAPDPQAGVECPQAAALVNRFAVPAASLASADGRSL
ncbi:nitrate reductase molybdenum cofactor assembly chaperone [Aquisediminimonas profunda]|uniref:nitrate reductase molybdenum cofactor assembly chaperone n=1 Tax=Aquisediminimonas profunda TaxID=1550733 RepID=UPI001C626A26|nr:nitrate reductase molybdenum cofactor assembly chaperone [Aquisediminimonas profunda]